MDERTREIFDRWGPLLRRLSGADDVVTGVCRECQFELGRASSGGYEHSQACSKREEPSR
jgi:hypothetical protein